MYFEKINADDTFYIVIGSTKYSTGQKTVFTRSAKTPPKVNRFGLNLEHCEHIVGGWNWQVLGAISVVTVSEAAEIFFG